ncbi:uncharacterized protein METZ01_LOCUS465424, partial [marine metagenome]
VSVPTAVLRSIPTGRLVASWLTTMQADHLSQILQFRL